MNKRVALRPPSPHAMIAQKKNPFQARPRPTPLYAQLSLTRQVGGE